MTGWKPGDLIRHNAEGVVFDAVLIEKHPTASEVIGLPVWKAVVLRSDGYSENELDLANPEMSGVRTYPPGTRVGLSEGWHGSASGAGVRVAEWTDQVGNYLLDTPFEDAPVKGIPG